ncbi:MAG: hypothetical protein ACTIA6_10255 [Pseudoclavibacter sp.]
MQRPTDTADALSALGWHASSTDGLRLDTTGPRDFQIGRAWSPHGTWDSIPAPGRLSVLLVTEGACLIQYGAREFAITENHVVLLDSAIPTRLSVLTPTVRYLWHLQAGILRNPLVQHGVGITHPVRRPAWLPLTSLSNALLAAEPVMTNSLHTARSLEHLVAALLETAPQQTPPIERTDTSQAFRAAMAFMEQNKHLPAFTVRDVADHFNMSDRRLQRIFSRYSTTPRRELERQRVQDLRDALSTATTEALANRRAFAILANTAGFVTSTQARAALQRAEKPSRHD